MNKQINSIVIVGGGTAGWMSATYLQKVLSRLNNDVKIIVIEPDTIPTIGVGEATIPTIRQFFELLEIPEVELFIKSNATIKTSIKFKNWLNENDNGYYHPFEAPVFSDGFTIAEHWSALRNNSNPLASSFAHDTGLVAGLCDENKILKTVSETNYNAAGAYAYHLDASDLAAMLKKIALERGVTCITDVVDSVNLNDSDMITDVVLGSGKNIKGDFFIDCTGFASLLIEKSLKDEYISYEDQLLCDAAITTPTVARDKKNGGPRCYTTSTAQSSGWIWEIDLPTRTGNGYVYSSQFLTTDEAKKELAQHLEINVSDDFKELKFKTGRRKEFWKNNCLSIGLSAGFIEPLESTGLQLIETGLRLFFEHFPDGSPSKNLSSQYNKLMADNFDYTKDFIVLHYKLSKRTDTAFWRHIQNNINMSENLKSKLKLWENKLPSATDFQKYEVFGMANYLYILAGMEALGTENNSKLSLLKEVDSLNLLNQMKNIQKKASDNCITHQDFMERIRAPFGLD